MEDMSMFRTKTIFAGFIFLVASQFAAKADDVYMVTSTQEFGTIDLNSGIFTQTGPNESVQVAGLGEIGSSLYASSYDVPAGSLYSVNPTNGVLTPIGVPTPVDYSDFGSTLTTLYAVDTSADLYSIDPTTGAVTLVGATGLTLSGYQNLSTNSSTLYFGNGANLYTLNTTTGAATLVGNMGGPEMGALVVDGGVLYGGNDISPSSVDTVDVGSGAATFQSTLSGTSGVFFGLAPIPTTATPEPRTVSWLLLGLLAGGVWIQKRGSNKTSKS
jgi:uncharacterized protein DUF6923